MPSIQVTLKCNGLLLRDHFNQMQLKIFYLLKPMPTIDHQHESNPTKIVYKSITNFLKDVLNVSLIL